MFPLFKYFAKDIGIDLGTANTLVYIPRKGVVMNEPSVVAYDTSSKTVAAVGHTAKAMCGKVPQHISIVRPLKDGVIADFKMATVLLKYFVKTAIKRGHFLRPKLVIAVPFGITEVEKKAVKDAAMQVGAGQVTIILEPMAAALGTNLPIGEPAGNMVVDIGGGTTDVAIIALAGIVAGQSLRIAGDEMNDAIIRYLRHKYNLLIGLRTAELIKTTIGSAFPFHAETSVEVRGRDLARGVPNMQCIKSEEIREALAEPVFAIIEAIRRTLEDTPPELAADIMQHGIVLTGGGALLKNLDLKLKDELGISIALADDPLLSVVMGTGYALSNPALLKRIAVE
jgi:rod shape-determining protein MreB